MLSMDFFEDESNRKISFVEVCIISFAPFLSAYLDFLYRLLI